MFLPLARAMLCVKRPSCSLTMASEEMALRIGAHGCAARELEITSQLSIVYNTSLQEATPAAHSSDDSTCRNWARWEAQVLRRAGAVINQLMPGERRIWSQGSSSAVRFRWRQCQYLPGPQTGAGGQRITSPRRGTQQ
jgi:hypothetical protein